MTHLVPLFGRMSLKLFGTLVQRLRGVRQARKGSPPNKAHVHGARVTKLRRLFLNAVPAVAPNVQDVPPGPAQPKAGNSQSGPALGYESWTAKVKFYYVFLYVFTKKFTFQLDITSFFVYFLSLSLRRPTQPFDPLTPSGPSGRH